MGGQTQKLWTDPFLQFLKRRLKGPCKKPLFHFIVSYPLPISALFLRLEKKKKVLDECSLRLPNIIDKSCSVQAGEKRTV